VSNGQTTPPAAHGPTGLPAFVEAMRIPHWLKNAFVLAPVLFAQRYADVAAWAFALGAALTFGLIGSATYLFNDVCDRRRDAAHPTKRLRPVASGRLSVAAALSGAAVLLLAGLVLAVALSLRRSRDEAVGGWGLLLWAGAYLLTNVLYSLWLKDKVIVDVILVAMGFVFRAMAGAAAIGVPVSPWLVLCTFTLCLFIALTKRRGELVELAPHQVALARPASRSYGPEDLEHMLTVSTAMAILTYSLYCIAPRTVAHFGSAHMIWTVPLVVYGMFRYNRVTRAKGQYDPAAVLLSDRITWLVLLAYVVLTALIIQFGRMASLRRLLDMD